MEIQNATKKSAWNPIGIGFYSVVFSFLPAGILYALNFVKLGKPKLKWPIIGGIALMYIIALFFLVFNATNNKIFYLLNLAAGYIFYFTQRNDFKKMLQARGEKASFKMPILYGIIFISLLIAGLYAYDRSRIEPIVQNDTVFSNEYITTTIPKGWRIVKNEPGDNDTIIYLEKENEVANISIDHTQDLLDEPNSATIKKYTPTRILDERLTSIEEDVKANPDINWKNFRRVGEIKKMTLAGLPAAEAHFMVDENIAGEGKTMERTITRIVVFTKNDLFNIVFASTNSSLHPEEEKEFSSFINGLKFR